MRIRIRLGTGIRQEIDERLQQAYAKGQVRLVRRIHAILLVVEGKPVKEVASQLGLGEQTVRDYVTALLLKGTASLVLLWCRC